MSRQKTKLGLQNVTEIYLLLPVGEIWEGMIHQLIEALEH